MSNSSNNLSVLNVGTQVQDDLLSKINNLDKNQLLWLSGYCNGLAQNASAAVAAAVSGPSSKPNILILFASQTGNAEEIAQALGRQLSARGTTAKVISTLDIKLSKLKDYEYIFVVASTHGEGEPPDDAIEFHEGIFGRKAPKLDGVQHSVLALGDSSYEFYCQTGKDFNQALMKCGSKPLFDLVECDVDYEQDAEQWVARAVEEIVKVQASHSSASVAQNVVHLHQSAASAGVTYSKDNPFEAEVLTIQKITARNAIKKTYHIEIDLTDSGIQYQPGDALGVIADNDSKLVADVIAQLDGDADTQVSYKDKLVALGELLSSELELTLLNKASLQKVYDLTQAAGIQAILAGEFSDYASAHQWLDVLLDKEVNLSAQQFVDIAKPLKPRLYSIASSLEEYEDEVHLTVNLCESENENGQRKGLASHYLIERLQEGDKIKVYIDTNKNFKLPADTDKPIVMVGPGTGVAPFRAFLQHRDATGAQGKNWLFFGNPNFQNDFLYQTELKKYLKSGVLNKISLAFSRDQAEKIYIQHRMQEEAAELWHWIDQEGASLYVCGDMTRMAKDVEENLLSIFSEQGKLDVEQAKLYLKKLKLEKRYQRDVY